jgi:S-adenosylmethionine:tRNA ribosyltransferase-isomerase
VNAAVEPSSSPRARRLLHLDPAERTCVDRPLADLPWLLRRGDLLVVNDAATLPASLPAQGPQGEVLEVRLTGPGEGERWTAVLFGPGDWRLRTEDRPAPALLRVGDGLRFPGGLRAVVTGLSPFSPRLVELQFAEQGAALWSALYAIGRPVQYSYLRRPLELPEVQTVYASRPWAVEPPSAGLPLTADLLLALGGRGVRLASVTHAAGLSSTGEAALDARLPLPERFEVGENAVRAVTETRQQGGRVVAVGTTVVRALESAMAHAGDLGPVSGITQLVVGPSHRLRVVDGLLTGVHEPGTSHFRLLTAFAPQSLLLEAFARAEAAGYEMHEFGDGWLLLSSRA